MAGSNVKMISTNAHPTHANMAACAATVWHPIPANAFLVTLESTVRRTLMTAPSIPAGMVALVSTRSTTTSAFAKCHLPDAIAEKKWTPANRINAATMPDALRVQIIEILHAPAALVSPDDFASMTSMNVRYLLRAGMELHAETHLDLTNAFVLWDTKERTVPSILMTVLHVRNYLCLAILNG